MHRWVIPAWFWVGFLVLLCSARTPAWAADEPVESPAAEPAKDAEHSGAADEEHGDEPAENAAHGEHAGDASDSEDTAHDGNAADAGDADAPPGSHGGAHEDPYDLGHQNGTDQLEDPSEFKSDLAIWTFVVFLCLLLLLLKFAWRPIMDGLEKRERSIAGMIDEAKASADKAAEQLRQYEAKLEAAGDKAREVLAQAQREAEGVKESIVAEAREAARRERERAVADIQTAKNVALQEITTHGVELAVTMAGRIVRRQLEPEDHAKLIREALDQLPSRN
ncbi:MAG: F0F1 ATP synthase subunit B [Pirellulaceae bacterium]